MIVEMGLVSFVREGNVPDTMAFLCRSLVQRASRKTSASSRSKMAFHTAHLSRTSLRTRSRFSEYVPSSPALMT